MKKKKKTNVLHGGVSEGKRELVVVVAVSASLLL